MPEHTLSRLDSISENTNLIKQMVVKDLLDGRCFFIPAYQRGYRWGKTQIYDLCNDLLDYALKKEQETKNLIRNKSFYCLQPIIAIPKQFKIKEQEKNGYEIVDGQQRLTSLYILYRYLVNVDSNVSLLPLSLDDKIKWTEGHYQTRFYSLYYETRPEDYDAILKIGFEPLTKEDITDIDISHLSNAYQYINTWYHDDINGAPKVLRRYKDAKTADIDITRYLLDLLRNDKDSTLGSVQVIWYELDLSKEAIREFIKENTGKIKLTDTELIKGLFLQKRNWEKGVRSLQQLSIGKDWELIENTLHHNDFWSFISNDIHQEDNRINIVFEYIYQKHNAGKALPKDSPNALFRFYDDYFERVGNMTALWEEVKECFQAMQNWYEDPYIYNLVGLLSKYGKSLHDIISIYNKKEVQTTQDFLWVLKKEVLKTLPEPENQDDLVFPDRCFKLFYGDDNNRIRNLLLFVNVLQYCTRLDKAREDIESGGKKSDRDRAQEDLLSAIYKFPFDILDSFHWDIEHIDSATTNSLQGTDKKKEWINGAESALGEKILLNSNYKLLKEKLEKEPKNVDANLSELIKQIKFLAEDDIEDGKEKKNWIGNLTLLDCGTNRSYGNALFVIKRKEIDKRLNDGVFVPICTRNVFEKVCTGCSQDSWRWSWQDKISHHQFLLDEYDKFLKEVEKHIGQKQGEQQIEE